MGTDVCWRTSSRRRGELAALRFPLPEPALGDASDSIQLFGGGSIGRRPTWATLLSTMRLPAGWPPKPNPCDNVPHGPQESRDILRADT